MVFTKMHGCGNDYIYIDCTKEFVENEEKAAIILSDRHFGVGGDGIILIKKGTKAGRFLFGKEIEYGAVVEKIENIDLSNPS